MSFLQVERFPPKVPLEILEDALRGRVIDTYNSVCWSMQFQ
jgi:hypothetical protein